MNKDELKIIFMGTPEFAVASLRMLVENGYNVVAVVTQPDKPVGRHATITAPPVKEYAIEKGIPILQPVKMKDSSFIEELASYQADLQVVVAFRMLPEIVWSMPKYGTFNVHASLLPQYRGAAPINWAIINGETETGVSTFFLDHEIDTGRIILQSKFNIPDDADAEYVYNGLMNLGAQLAKETIDLLIHNEGKVKTIQQPQEIELKVAPKIFKENCEISWNNTCKNIFDFVRGLSPYPGTWTNIRLPKDNEVQTIKIYKTKKTDYAVDVKPGLFKVENKKIFISTKDYWLEIIELQQVGKKRMSAKDFINGLKK